MRSFDRASRRPTFLVIGAAKSATTSLHEYLRQHPDVFMPQTKEPNYFAFAEGLPDFKGPDDENLACAASPDGLRVAKYGYSICDPDAYLRLFADARRERAVGESSVSSMYFPGVAERINEALPDVRLVAVLRNPVDRAFSKYVQFRRDGLEPHDTFEEALAAEDGRVARNWSPTWFYVRRGLYHEQLCRFYEVFERERIRVHLYEDLEADADRVLEDLFGFVGVDNLFSADTSTRYNASARARRTPRAAWPDRLARSRVLTRPVGRLSARGLDSVQRGITRANSRPSPWSPPTLAPGTRKALAERFAPDVLALSALIQRDLSHWLEPDSS